MRQVAAHQFFDHERGVAPSAGFHAAGLNHLLIAIGRAMSPPVVHMRSTFQPMRVIVVQPDLAATVSHAAEWGCETPQLLPSAQHPGRNSNQHDPSWRSRIVQGEILSDESGRLFEKLGSHIRPVHQLASGPAGELIEMIPAERNNVRVLSKIPKVAPVNERSVTNEKQELTTATRDSVLKKFVPFHDVDNGAVIPAHRKLFTDPGQWRVVTWGEFKEILAPQLAHPERLRDTYRLPCYVQVVETNRDVTIEELAQEFSTKTGRPTPLYFLTDELAEKLELVSLLPPLPATATGARRAPNVLSANERVFRLLVANDPTGDIGNSRKRDQTAQETPPTKSASQTNQQTPATARKVAVPDSFVNEWEFKLSRDEALYDMNSRSLFSAMLRFMRRLRLFKQHSEFRKWQVLLSGKTSDEQLWRVRPPSIMMNDSFVREWAKKTLELAGYDSDKMLNEWEIFWRRKGLH